MKWLFRLLTGSDLSSKKAKANQGSGPVTVKESDYSTTSTGLQFYDLKAEQAVLLCHRTSQSHQGMG